MSEDKISLLPSFSLEDSEEEEVDGASDILTLVKITTHVKTPRGFVPLPAGPAHMQV